MAVVRSMCLSWRQNKCWIGFLFLIVAGVPHCKSWSMAPAMLNRKPRCLVQRRRIPLVAAAAAAAGTMASSDHSYGIAGVDLSSHWLELVRDNRVSATTTLDDGTEVEYGVTITEQQRQPLQQQESTSNGSRRRTLSFFVRSSNDQPVVDQMNATLKEQEDGTMHGWSDAFLAQLQLVRTLRPPSSFSSSPSSSSSLLLTSSTPPPYNAETDSFLVGPLRLGLRPKVATLDPNNSSSSSSSNNNNKQNWSTPWDIYHNVSPVDVRGHFLLVPTLDRPETNHRAQQLTREDCRDMVALAQTIQPPGSLLLAYNSVGAGASQNHLHCHLWPSPPLAQWWKGGREGEEEEEHENDDGNNPQQHVAPRRSPPPSSSDGWNWYAVSRAKGLVVDCLHLAIPTTTEGEEGMVVKATYLEYPCFCILLSSSSVQALGRVLGTIVLESLGDAPYNIGILSRPNDDDAAEGENNECVDVYLFVRSRERSPTVVPNHKLGCSEMMGVFHAQSKEQLRDLLQDKSKRTEDNNNNIASAAMVQALKDVSHDHPRELWETIRESLNKAFPSRGSIC